MKIARILRFWLFYAITFMMFFEINTITKSCCSIYLLALIK